MTTTTRTQLMMTRGVMFAFVAIAAAGCQSSRFDSIDTRPEPLTAAPSGQVSSSQLPPPTAAGPTDPSAFPPAPGQASGTQVASATPGATPPPLTPPANAAPVTKEAMVGAWRVNSGGSGCQMMLSLTKMSADFRAASLRCPGDAANVAAWNVAGSQVVLKDNSGNTVARLYASGAQRYDGQTTGGQSISFSR